MTISLVPEIFQSIICAKINLVKLFKVKNENMAISLDVIPQSHSKVACFRTDFRNGKGDYTTHQF